MNVYDLIKNSIGREVSSVVPIFLTADEINGAVASLNLAYYYGKIAVTGKDMNFVGTEKYLVFSLAGKIVFSADISQPVIDSQTQTNIIFDEVYLTDGLGLRVTNPVVITSEGPAFQQFTYQLEAEAGNPYDFRQGVVNIAGSGDQYWDMYNNFIFVVNEKVGFRFSVSSNNILPGTFYFESPLSFKGFVDNRLYSADGILSGSTIIAKTIAAPLMVQLLPNDLTVESISDPVLGFLPAMDANQCALSEGKTYTIYCNRISGSVELVMYAGDPAFTIPFLTVSKPIENNRFSFQVPTGYVMEGNVVCEMNFIESIPTNFENKIVESQIAGELTFNDISVSDLESSEVPVYVNANNVINKDGYGGSFVIELWWKAAFKTSMNVENNVPFQFSAINDFDTIIIKSAI